MIQLWFLQNFFFKPHIKNNHAASHLYQAPLAIHLVYEPTKSLGPPQAWNLHKLPAVLELLPYGVLLWELTSIREILQFTIWQDHA